MLLLNFGLFGIKYKKEHEFGDETLPEFKKLEFLFFQAVYFKKGSTSRYLKYAWDMHNDKFKTLSWHKEMIDAKTKNRIELNRKLSEQYEKEFNDLKERNSYLTKRFQKIDYENHALRQSIKIINNETVDPDFLRSP